MVTYYGPPLGSNRKAKTSQTPHLPFLNKTLLIYINRVHDQGEYICAISPACICITRPARGALFPHISPLRSKGIICNISPERSEGDILDTHKKRLMWLIWQLHDYYGHKDIHLKAKTSVPD
eukprot:sb/3475955/